MKKMFSVMGVLVVVAMLVTACAPATTPTLTQAPTEATTAAPTTGLLQLPAFLLLQQSAFPLPAHCRQNQAR